MLGKLLKHEFIATGRLFVPVFALVLVLTPILGLLTRLVDLGEDASGVNAIIAMLGGLSIFGYVLLLTAAAIAAFVFIIVRFYRSMTTDEAYLTFTIPATPSQIIVSKLIPALVWVLLTFIIVFFSIGLYTFLLGAWRFVDLANAWSLLMEGLRTVFQTADASVYGLIAIYGIMMIISFIANILQFYASIALGQLVNSHRLLASFGFYVAIYSILQVLALIFMIPLMSLGEKIVIEQTVGFMYGVSIVALFFSIVMAVGFYLTTVFCFKKKLNLE